MTVADSIRAIVGKVEEQTTQTTHSNFIGTVCKSYNVDDNDLYIDHIRRVATEYAAGKVVTHYKKAKELEPAVHFVLEGNAGTVCLPR